MIERLREVTVARGAGIALAALAVTLAACGGGGDGDTSGAGVTAPDGQATLEPPTTPTREECATEQLEASEPPDDLVPPPGDYTYEVDGTRRTLGAAGGETRLPDSFTFTITEARSIGQLRCFTIHRPYTPQLADQTTFVVRGGEAYVTRVRAIAAGRAIEIVPNPPIKALSGDDLEWSGSFRGPTRGTYAGSLLGRRAIRVGGRRERALGVELRLSLAGELRGTSVTRTWFSQESNLVLQEDARQERTAGAERLVLDYEARIDPQDVPR